MSKKRKTVLDDVWVAEKRGVKWWIRNEYKDEEHGPFSTKAAAEAFVKIFNQPRDA
jgi:hypothetical protein